MSCLPRGGETSLQGKKMLLNLKWPGGRTDEVEGSWLASLLLMREKLINAVSRRHAFSAESLAASIELATGDRSVPHHNWLS